MSEDVYRYYMERAAEVENERMRARSGLHLRDAKYQEKLYYPQEEIAMQKILEIMKRRPEWTTTDLSKHTALKKETLTTWLWDMHRKRMVKTKKHEKEGSVRLWYI